MRLILFLFAASLASAQVVTDTQWVTHGKGKELLRKINGRWWSQDNREVYPPSRTGVFWELDSEPGVVEFFHHEPFDLRRAESLHLFMTVPEVEYLLGRPNRIFRMGPDGGMWMYYGSNGTMVQVRIMEGVLGEADYKPAKGKDYPVASVAADLGGRSIYKLMAERATKRSAQEQAQRVADLRAGRLPQRQTKQTASQPSQPVTFAPPPEKHVISPETLASVQIGMSRTDVLTALGEPTSKFSLTGGDGLRETFRYHLPDGSPVEIRLVDGKVTQVP